MSAPTRDTSAADSAAAVVDTVAVADQATDRTPEPEGATGGFRVRLRNFEGPFDLLLTLISQRRLDVTEVALHEVTDEFIAYTRQLGPVLGLDQTTEFLVVAATLLDLKAARLLPSGNVDDPEDLALLEARDLLFARLLQYRAYKQIAEQFAELENAALRRYPRAVSLEECFENLVPEVVLGVDAQRFAEIAAAAFRPKPIPTVGLDHLHVATVSVPEQAAHILALLKDNGAGQWVGFDVLTADCEHGLLVVARFLALLELYRERAVTFEQPDPLGPLEVAWTGENDENAIDFEEDYG
ncbi:segregation and condensation protein A [Rhodococcus artemisiae]|uniref:Segregation and condensation protein A n=1 Tax=Rhodococcus artemisiae TaxID=714159 RepID=A0ABU7LL36_9NOCA|nr:segregation/condensation protein A [Rhodococcus artemisiae]MEE2062258.1 segregation/condensation protein A [Rhodococcus artemisiae]